MASWVAPALITLPLLSGCGPSPEEITNHDDPAILTAAESGDVAGIRALIAAGAPPDTRDACQWTPLMKAALNGRTEAVETLLNGGATPGLGDKGGYTALMLAASNGHNGALAQLLQRGSNPDHVERTNGWTALIWAAKRGHADTVDLLLRGGANPGIRGFDGKSAADWARDRGFEVIVRRLEAPPSAAPRQ